MEVYEEGRESKEINFNISGAQRKKIANSRQVFRLDADLIKNVTSSIGYEHCAEDVFQRKHLLKHPEHGIKTFVYEIDLLNFLLETVEKKLMNEIFCFERHY